jgi:hypothetical protein
MDQVDNSSVQVESQPTQEFQQSAQQEFAQPIEQPSIEEQTPRRDYETEYNNVSEALKQERSRADEAQRRAEFIERVALNNVPQQYTEPEPEFDPNYIPDNATVDKLIEKRMAPILNQVKDQQLLNQENAVRTQNPDWDEVFEYYKQIAKEDPEMHNLVMASKNPAQRAYRLGKSHPDYEKKVGQTAAGAVVNRISNNLSSPPTLNNINGASQTGEIDWSQATRAQVLARAKQIEGF